MKPLDEPALRSDLRGFARPEWVDSLLDASAEKLRPGMHGDLEAWLAALASLPEVSAAPLSCDGAAVRAEVRWDGDSRSAAEASLRALMPWRKGPFAIGDLTIDSEWRSDLKWQRVAASLSDLRARRVLDVGCGNGYYALRTALAGARLVIGIDPTLLFVAQFAAIRHFIEPVPVHVLPLRLEELPPGAPGFDTVFSMGVLYHQRQPLEHLQALHHCLRPGGELVLETLVLEAPGSDVLVPTGRYARMRNVWHLPTVGRLSEWLEAAGFAALTVADVAVTTTAEQRATAWMPFESLQQALDPNNPALTVEGLPAPRRCLVICSRPER